MADTWVGVCLVLASFSGMLFGLRALRRRRFLHPEWTRKSLHVAMGTLALGLPWLFTTNWPVISLAIILVLFLIALRHSRRLKRLCGGVIDAVERETVGEICFPIAVAVLYLLSERDPILFCIPVVIVTFSDAAAALVGNYYGRLRYKSFGAEKSIEGSLAFLACTLASVSVPLLIFTGTGNREIFLIAVTMSFFLTILEGLSAQGLDNLFLPLGAFVLLETYLTLSAGALALQLAAALLSFIIFTLFCLRSLRLSRQLQGGLL